MNKKICYMVIVILLICLGVQHWFYSDTIKDLDKDKIFFKVTSKSLDIKDTDDYSLSVVSDESNGKLKKKSSAYSIHGGYGSYKCEISISKEKIKKSFPDYTGEDLKIKTNFYCANEMNRAFLCIDIKEVDKEKGKYIISQILYYDDVECGDGGEYYTDEEEQQIDLNKNETNVIFDFQKYTL